MISSGLPWNSGKLALLQDGPFRRVCIFGHSSVGEQLTPLNQRVPGSSPWVRPQN